MPKNLLNPTIMWKPNEHSGKSMKEFQAYISRKYSVKLDDYWDFHKWSVDNFHTFWGEIWDRSGINFSVPYAEVCPSDITVEDSRKWFPGARLNVAENLLRYRDNGIAYIATGESRLPKMITYSDLYKETCVYSLALRKLGLCIGDNVSCYMSNREEAVITMLGATSIGGVFSGVLPQLGVKPALNRFKFSQTKFLFTIDHFFHAGEEINMLPKIKEISENLGSLVKIIIVPSRPESMTADISGIKNSCYLPEFRKLGHTEDGKILDLDFVQLPFNHPVFISYTSGTTGHSKAVVHGASCLLVVYRNIGLHGDSTRRDIWLSGSPAGWASWILVSMLLFLGVTVVMFEGVPYYLTPTYLWDMIDQYKLTHIFLTPKVLDRFEADDYVPNLGHDLSSLKFIMCAGSVVKNQNYAFVYKIMKYQANTAVFISAYGSSEIMGFCFAMEFTVPVHQGEIQAPALAANVLCFNEKGKSVVGEPGEIVIATPTPSLPLYMLRDHDNSLFKKTYFSKFEGVFALHDIGTINPMTHGLIIHCRSDDSLNPYGFRFGSSDIYDVVIRFPEIDDSICVAQYKADKSDERVILFVKMKQGQFLTDDLIGALKLDIALELTRDCVPAFILAVKDIPYNLNGKKMESTVRKIINKMPLKNEAENVTTPECLSSFMNIPELKKY